MHCFCVLHKKPNLKTANIRHPICTARIMGFIHMLLGQVSCCKVLHRIVLEASFVSEVTCLVCNTDHKHVSLHCILYVTILNLKIWLNIFERRVTLLLLWRDTAIACTAKDLESSLLWSMMRFEEEERKMLLHIYFHMEYASIRNHKEINAEGKTSVAVKHSNSIHDWFVLTCVPILFRVPFPDVSFPFCPVFCIVSWYVTRILQVM